MLERNDLVNVFVTLYIYVCVRVVRIMHECIPHSCSGWPVGDFIVRVLTR